MGEEKCLPSGAYRGWLLPVLLQLLLLAPLATKAQEEPPTLSYRTTVAPTGNSALDGLLRGTSGLIALQTRAPTDAEGVLSRIGAEAEKLRPALESEGYWAARIEVVAPGIALEPAAMAAAPAPLALEIRTTLGPRYVFRNIQTNGATPIPLTPGEPARADAVLAAQAAALNAMRLDARPLAHIERAVTVDHAAHAMDVVFTATPGPQAEFADPTVTGTQRVNPEVVRRVAALRLAERSFSPTRINAARADVSALGAFSSVRVDPGSALDADGRLPVNVTVRERPFRAITASAGYETNYGISLRAAWEHRNVLGGAENLRVELEGSRIGNALDRTNARAAVIWRQPLPLGYEGSLVGSLAFVRERLESYDRDAGIFSLLYERRLSERWTLSTGP
ncbi:MAG: hypothetical protein JWR10_2392, partial [Rubritepida sp.]|nr:hypothetical protein [Rubritepida sp.]